MLLIDADMRRGVLNRILDARRDPGLSDFLAGRAELRRVIRPIVLRDGGTLDLIPTGILPENRPSSSAVRTCASCWKSTAAQYDAVLIDYPAAQLIRRRDGCLLLWLMAYCWWRVPKTASGALNFAAEQLRRAKVQVIGALLNDYDPSRDSRGEGKYDYYGPQQYAYTAEEAAR